MLPFLVNVLFMFYIQDELKLKNKFGSLRVKRVEMAWNMVLNLNSAVSISGQDTTDISLAFPHYAVSLVACQEFLPTN